MQINVRSLAVALTDGPEDDVAHLLEERLLGLVVDAHLGVGVVVDAEDADGVVAGGGRRGRAAVAAVVRARRHGGRARGRRRRPCSSRTLM